MSILIGNIMNKMIQNDLFLRALKGEALERVPVWMMRQAGRYLPDYLVLKAKYSFFERCQNPELATEITVMPIDQIGMDAAIIFSDILVVPQAMGMVVEMHEGKGPLLPEPLRTSGDIAKLVEPDVNETLGYVFEALKHTKQALAGRVPLIGFAGSPWTLFCYMVEGKGSKTFDVAKSFCFQHPELSRRVLDMITDTTIAYLKGQVLAGADCVQVFDSWGGLLGPEDFTVWSLPYLQRITTALKEDCPVILFAKGAWYALEDLAQTGASALGVDWCITPEMARSFAGADITLQGNFDPAKLLGTHSQIRREAQKMVKRFGNKGYIANLGHGILPNTKPDQARAFVDAVKEFKFV